MELERSGSISLSGSIQLFFTNNPLDISMTPSKDMNLIPKLEFGSIIEDSVKPKPPIVEPDSSKLFNMDYPDDDTECDVKDYAELNDVTDRTNRLVLEDRNNKDYLVVCPQDVIVQLETTEETPFQEYSENNNHVSELEMHLIEMGDETEQLREQIRKLKQENQDLKNDCLDALDENFQLQNNFVPRLSTDGDSMELNDENMEKGTSETQNQTNSVTSLSLLNHEKEMLLQKTKSQENEIMALRLRVEAYEEEKKKNHSEAFNEDERESMEKEISALRGKVALLERNNKLFSNQERQMLKQDLERTKRRCSHLSEQYSALKNSTESNHISQVETALSDYVKKVKYLEQENARLRDREMHSSSELDAELNSCLEEKEEIIKDQSVMIDELQHLIKFIKSERGMPGRKQKSTSDHEVQIDLPGYQSPRAKRLSERSRSPGKHRSSKEDANQSDSSSEPYSDSDARAIRALSGRMRQDIEEAKQKLKDMGEALIASQHVSPAHFPLKLEHTSPRFTKYKDENDTERLQLSPYIKKRTLSLSSIPIHIQRKSDQDETDHSKGTMSSSNLKSKGTASWSPGLLLSNRSGKAADASNIFHPITPKSSRSLEKYHENRKKVIADNKSEIKQAKSRILYKSIPKSTTVQHMGENDFFRIKSLDYKIMEEEIECNREEYDRKRQREKLRKSDERTSIDSTKQMKTRQERHKDAARRKEKISKKKKTSKYLPYETEEVYEFVEPEILSNLKMSPYRVYVVKRDHTPPDDGDKMFPELLIHAGDVVFSLGAPEMHKDGKKYQLAEVNGSIGFVPFSILQHAEQVDQFGTNPQKLNIQHWKAQRRIVDVFKRLEDKRRSMGYGT
ncbi:uncharacterized protein LOC120339381 isoform X1 [Styela clava]